MLGLQLSKRTISMLYLVKFEENYLGHSVSSSTEKEVRHSSRSVADGRDLHRDTHSGDDMCERMGIRRRTDFWLEIKRRRTDFWLRATLEGESSVREERWLRAALEEESCSEGG
ncbi:hypothetical protein NC653_037225 [Populus alba x Populus x berolinensis]|uniref:Uncharacterized protein n=1 Tax=Populus alba x Populus x berolinensis TaxID=444605 RepID=A0AAD6LDW1_9ROSI|nr:hypothetical protein NC653_037225 [Populus alba x Populus x berolinensis]